MYPKRPAFALGGTLEPVYKLYKEHNPLDDTFDEKARAIYQWLLGHRTQNGNYFNCGYSWPVGATTDAGFSCDLTDVGRGLIAYYQIFKDEQALEHAVGLAQYFLNEANPGTYDGLWSESNGTFLIGPTPGAGFENVKVDANQASWVWSSYYGAHWLARLYDCTSDDSLKDRIRDRCVRSLRWNLDCCQFDDGAIGMSARDDKWLGSTAMTILQYLELHRRNMLDTAFHREYLPRALKALSWLEKMSQPGNFPPDGYIPVHMQSFPDPGCNTIWLMALTVEGLLSGPALRSLCTLELE
ncbi:MAG: hypothetical protein EHM70_19080 [Chloroflexota bacterium]|nr:MAG: hypothetical protein EHM70_19080 [Chloroflexota bacterium]